MASSLHNHTMYSLLDGYGTPEEMLNRAVKVGLKAFAITEHGSEYSWVYFDMIPGDYELRSGKPQYTGKLVVIGTRIDERELKRLFGME